MSDKFAVFVPGCGYPRGIKAIGESYTWKDFWTGEGDLGGPAVFTDLSAAISAAAALQALRYTGVTIHRMQERSRFTPDGEVS